MEGVEGMEALEWKCVCTRESVCIQKRERVCVCVCGNKRRGEQLVRGYGQIPQALNARSTLDGAIEEQSPTPNPSGHGHHLLHIAELLLKQPNTTSSLSSLQDRRARGCQGRKRWRRLLARVCDSLTLSLSQHSHSPHSGLFSSTDMRDRARDSAPISIRKHASTVHQLCNSLQLISIYSIIVF